MMMTFCYARIGLSLKRAKAPGESIKARDDKMIESKKRVSLILPSYKGGYFCICLHNINHIHHFVRFSVLITNM